MVTVRPSRKVNIGQYAIISTYSQRVTVLLQGSDRCVWVTDVHCVASALCVGQPQQQRMEAFMELLFQG